MKKLPLLIFAFIAVSALGQLKAAAGDMGLFEYKTEAIRSVLKSAHVTRNMTGLAIVVKINRQGTQLAKDGKPMRPTILRSTGDDRIDAQGVEAASKVTFPPLPKSYKGKVLKLTVDFGDLDVLNQDP
jgi:hypothetical protein